MTERQDPYTTTTGGVSVRIVASETVAISCEFLMKQREALLMQVDAIERVLCISPRTGELRHQYRTIDKRPEQAHNSNIVT